MSGQARRRLRLPIPGQGRNRTTEGRLDALLDDPATTRAALSVFALTRLGDAPLWPFAAAVGPRSVTLRLAGPAAPDPPPEPWRPGHDAGFWVADRDKLTGDFPRTLPDPLLIGRFDDTLVFVNTARAPGPINLDGDDPATARVRELVEAQQPARPAAEAGAGAQAQAQVGADWPMEVRDGAIFLLGLAVAHALSPADTRRAIALTRQAAELRAKAPEPGDLDTSAPVASRPDEQADTPAPAPASASTSTPAPDSESAAVIPTAAAAQDAHEISGDEEVPEVPAIPSIPAIPDETEFPGESTTIPAASAFSDPADSTPDETPEVLPPPAPEISDATETPDTAASSATPPPDDDDDWSQGFSVSSAAEENAG